MAPSEANGLRFDTLDLRSKGSSFLKDAGTPQAGTDVFWDFLSVMQFVLTLLRNSAVIEERTKHKGARRAAR